MDVKIMSWNMAGAKLFEQLGPEPEPAAGRYIAAFRKVWLQRILPWLSEGEDDNRPELILLQECIGLQDHSDRPSSRWQGGAAILQEIFVGYECFFFPAVTSNSNPHPGKWNRYGIPSHIEIEQGYGVCILKGERCRKLWVPWADSTEAPVDADRADTGFRTCFELIPVSTALYQGTRDTEPRLLIMGRLKLEQNGESRYLNYLNVHLNTLSGEREGDSQIDQRASGSRLRQVEFILDDVIAAYQQATRYRVLEEEGQRDLWVIGGDFNAVPESAEIARIRASGFVDATADKRIEDENGDRHLNQQWGSKWSLGDKQRPALVLDYIFCGVSPNVDSAKVSRVEVLNIEGSRRPFSPRFDDAEFATDHALLFAKISL
ncbi:MAG: hypothetical protein HOD58_16440 [Gammaproteobacteria bacterium]|jgi:endonuclease/exonuclease/phosphatase family metal-dependent hydrolase|nr:hypothetical protein [Gammaproteobacteria bacterium]MBT4331500.1 hypothetical protein [Gammaproteobacteria bacterium]MBT4605932.1 hypothetical protein [Thiotrichales bacterium]MBT5635865.1 hypothetical protein [Gammaproteobacteria bacterium]MBT6079651.1 hypothetical protein [Gammaproteobacteria bacterium]